MLIYVNANAGRDGNGKKGMPFKRINDVAKIAQPGDEVVVSPGIYREYVDPVYAGTEDARIIYRSEEPLGAVITGAEQVDNWELFEGNVWMTRVKNSIFGGYNPYKVYVYGDWYFAKEDKHTGCVYLNDQVMYEAASLEECIRGEVYECSWVPEKSVYKWYTEQDGEKDETVLYGNFQGKNPNVENVEINVRRECFMPSKTSVNYITVSGFQINKAATTWAPPAAFQDGMIGPHWSKGWIIEDCEISNSKCAGISLGKYLDPENNHYFTYKQVKSPTQMERDAVCRGQYHGWLKENIGGHIIRRNHIHHCQQGGIIGRMGGVFSVIEDNHIHHINNMMELGGAEIAGIKMHAAIDVIIAHDSDEGFDTENRAVGTWMFDDYPTYEEWIAQFDFTKPADMKRCEPAHFGHLPIWSEGNVYLGGARPCRQEKNGLVVDDTADTGTDDAIRVELVEKDGNYYLDTNLYEKMEEFSGNMISTETLGKAFEPEQRFENPDGTPMLFDSDYLGEHRGITVIPGPFASAVDSRKVLF